MRHSMIGGCASAITAPHARNSLPDSLHKLSSLNNFKKHLKSHLFKISLVQHDSSDVKHSGGSLVLTMLSALLAY